MDWAPPSPVVPRNARQHEHRHRDLPLGTSPLLSLAAPSGFERPNTAPQLAVAAIRRILASQPFTHRISRRPPCGATAYGPARWLAGHAERGIVLRHPNSTRRRRRSTRLAPLTARRPPRGRDGDQERSRLELGDVRSCTEPRITRPSATEIGELLPCSPAAREPTTPT